MLGGAPFNVAWHLKGFDLDPLLVSRVGNDDGGKKILSTMQTWGMDTSGIEVDPFHGTGEVEVTLEQGTPRFNIVPDMSYDYINAPAHTAQPPELIYHGSLALRNPVASQALSHIVEDHPAPIFLDINLRPPWWSPDQISSLMDRATWLKVNDEELVLIEPKPDNLREKAQIVLQRHNLELILVTEGERGAFAMSETGETREVAPAAEITVTETVGAGDAFSAVCILGLLQKWPLTITLQRAQQFASLVVMQQGATLSDLSTYRDLLRAWR